MVRKLCSVVTVLVMLLLLLTVIPVSPAAAVELNTELLKNGNFETVNSNGVPSNFSGFKTWTNGSVTGIAEGVNYTGSEGNNAMVIDVKSDSDGPYVYQRAQNLPGGFKYKMSLWYMGVTTQAIGVKFTEYDSSNTRINESFATPLTASSTWKKAEHEFYAQLDTASISVAIIGYKTGTTVYIDDLSLMMVDGPEQFDMDTDWVFYYENYDKATVTVTMNDFYEDEGYTAAIRISRGVNKISEITGLTFTDNKIVHKADITALVPKNNYTLQVSIRDNTGATIKTIRKTICRINRPTAINEDGVYMVDGKPFEPVIAYHITAEDYEEAMEGGINVVQWNPSNPDDKQAILAELDAMHELGMKAAAVCYWGMRPAGHSTNAARTEAFVTNIKDHPAVFGYMIMDEPFSHNPEAESDLMNSYKIIRSIDDVHPVYCCEDQITKYPVTAKYVDCLAIDPYPGNGKDYGRHVTEMTLAAREGVKYEKPVYNILQACTFVTTPTAEQLRSMIYQGFMAGAQGMGYYTWMPDYPELDGYLNEGRYWSTITSFKSIDQPLLFEYYGRGEHPAFRKYRDNDLWYEGWVSGDDIYMAVLNRTDSDAEATIPLTSTNKKLTIDNYTMSVVSGGDMSAVTQESGSFTVALTGYQAVLYKITPAQVPDYDLIDDLAVNGSFEKLTDNVLDAWSFINTTQADALQTTGGSDGTNFITLSAESSRADAVFTGESGKIYTIEFDYISTEDRAGLVTADATPGYRQTAIWLPSSGGEWASAKLTVKLTGEDDGGIVVRFRNASGTSDVSYDNIRVMPLKAENRILLLNESGEEITNVSGLTGRVTAYTEGLDTGDRLYIALYGESYGEERLKDIAVVTAQSKKLISCALEGVAGSGLKVKAFVLSGSMGAKLVKVIE